MTDVVGGATLANVQKLLGEIDRALHDHGDIPELLDAHRKVHEVAVMLSTNQTGAESDGDATPAGGASGVSEAEVEAARVAGVMYLSFVSGHTPPCEAGADWHIVETRFDMIAFVRAALLAASKVRESRGGGEASALLDDLENIARARVCCDQARSAVLRDILSAIVHLRASLRASTSPADQAGEGWLPIESAPKNGTEIDVWGRQSIHGFWDKWTDPQRVINAKWCEHPLTGGHATWRDKRFDFDTIIKDVTHYRLITTPPRDAAASAGEPR